MSRRDEFPAPVMDMFAKRVGFRCSNPNCRKLTAGPREEQGKAVNIGVAAHITAAAPGGPRYNAVLSTEERSARDNGIWLCQSCAKLIDNDPTHYTVELMRSWKLTAEEAARSEIEGNYRPNVTSDYSGILTPHTELLFSPEGGGAIPKIQIGNSATFFIGPDNLQALQLFPTLRAREFRVENVDGKMRVSTQIFGREGHLLAELVRNEWKVAPPPHTWDRNYTDDALEVRDARGRIVLQVRALIDCVQIQGLWWIDMGPPNGITQLIVRADPESSGAQFIFAPRDIIDPPSIMPMFEYPSERHLGELRTMK